MQTNLQRSQRLFAQPVRYEVPDFQRRYVWKQDEQWEPLWDDVADTPPIGTGAPNLQSLNADLRRDPLNKDEECYENRAEFRAAFDDLAGLWAIVVFTEGDTPSVTIAGQPYEFLCLTADDAFQQMPYWSLPSVCVRD